jgi:methionyl-tRNA synthetase
MSGRKMSKSLGNVVDPVIAIERWGIDPLRYFLVRSGRSGTYAKDMEFSNQLLAAVYAKELQANIGNLFQRVARQKTGKWSTYEACQAYRDGKFKIVDEDDGNLGALHKAMMLAPSCIRDAMDSLNTAEATDQVFNLLKEVRISFLS